MLLNMSCGCTTGGGWWTIVNLMYSSFYNMHAVFNYTTLHSYHVLFLNEEHLDIGLVTDFRSDAGPSRVGVKQ